MGGSVSKMTTFVYLGSFLGRTILGIMNAGTGGIFVTQFFFTSHSEKELHELLTLFSPFVLDFAMETFRRRLPVAPIVWVEGAVHNVKDLRPPLDGERVPSANFQAEAESHHRLSLSVAHR
jgi:hypothetical protein